MSKWEVIGHQNIIQFLENQIKENKVAPCYLFLGTEKIGKFTLAKAFAKALLCGRPSFCRVCLSCQQFDKGLHPDLLIIENRGHIFIEQIRELKQKIYFLPSLSKKKVIIFEEASLLTPQAQNALLKTLEEPPSFATIILVSQKENLFPTILSRCQEIFFLPVSDKTILNIFLKEGLKKEKAKVLASLCQGKVGQALSLGDKEAFLKDWQKRASLLSQMAFSSLKEKMDFCQKADPKETLFSLLLILREVLFLKLGLKKDFLNLKKLASKYDLKKLHFLIKKIQEFQNLTFLNINQRLLLENLVLDL